MYSEYSELIQNMLIETIDRFEKDDSRLKNYVALSELTIGQFLTGMVRTADKLTSFDENRVAVQLTLLKSIIYKCHNKKEVRTEYLGKPFISCLLELLELISSAELNDSRQKILEAGMSIICMTMPNKKKEGADRSSQIAAILSVLLKITDGFPPMKDQTRRKVM